MSVEGKLPHLSVAADDPDRARLARLHHAYDRMGGVVRSFGPVKRQSRPVIRMP